MEAGAARGGKAGLDWLGQEGTRGRSANAPTSFFADNRCTFIHTKIMAAPITADASYACAAAVSVISATT
jgi:hypothetical protein